MNLLYALTAWRAKRLESRRTRWAQRRAVLREYLIVSGEW